MIRIKKILLWSNDFEKKEIDLSYDGITVIIGDSKAGKSALISIIDYCLASSECDIPVGPIRNSCSWFGILLKLGNSDVLLARKCPSGANVSNDMSFHILENEEIPSEIYKNITRNEVKNYFNEYFELTNLAIDENDFTKEYVPSFRDTIGINFFPQDLLLNKNYYFYKQDISIHDKHLKFMFPYFMGVLTMQDVVNKKEYDNILRMVSLLSKSNSKNVKVLTKWEMDSKEKILKAMELGVTQLVEIPDAFEDRIKELKKVQENILNKRINTTRYNLSNINSELEKLQISESKLYSEIFVLNKKLYEIRRHRTSIDKYSEENSNFKDSKRISEWILNDEYLQSEVVRTNDSYANMIYNQIVNALRKEEVGILFYENIKVSLDKEYYMLLEEEQKLIDKLDYVRKCIKKFVNESSEIKMNLDILEELYRYVGELDNYIKLYEIMLNDSTLDEQLTDLNIKKSYYESLIDESIISDKYDSFDMYLKGTLETILDNLNVEYKGEMVWFDSKKIEFKFACTKSGVSLSKIGSGSNFVEYHVAMAFLLHIYIQNCVKHKCTFDFIFLDQPSEAYFPSKEENAQEKTDKEKNNDNLCLKAMFKTISNLRDYHASSLQVVVTEHADEGFWKNSEGIFHSTNIKIIDWKKNGEKLIPISWIPKNNDENQNE